MGDHTCRENGVVHSRCRCPKSHTIQCPNPQDCAKAKARAEEEAD